MPLEPTLKPGDVAPDFILKDQDGKETALSSMRGKKALLSFHPLAFTGVCEIQMRTLELKFAALAELNTVAFGISVDSVPCKKAWADAMGMTRTRMLADFWPHGEVAKKYGVFVESAGFSGRVNIVIDENGNIAMVKVYDKPEIPDIEAVLKFLKG
ncbi:MAG: redoxin domain-containing protein [Brevinematales bacterium]|nr:redoxin domain-containing protein [Brevinematales bacterium]